MSSSSDAPIISQNPSLALKAKNSVKSFLAGFAGGIGLVAVGAPFDLTKVRMQSNPMEYPNVKITVQKTYQEGFLAFYKGSMVPLLLTSARNATLWACYAAFYQNAYHVTRPEDISLDKVFIAGCFAGFGNAFVEGPADLLKSKVQMQKGKAGAQYTGSMDCARQIVRRHGILGLYQAQHAVWLRNTPANGIYMATFQYLRRRHDEPPSAFQTFLYGGTAGTMYWIGAFPLDVVKTSLQTDASDPAQRKYKSYMHCVQSLYQRDGIRAFTRGFLPCIMRSFPANGMCYILISAMMELNEKW